MNLAQKLNFFLSSSLKRSLFKLGVLMFFGMLFEMAGIGILIPVLGLLLNPDLGHSFPALQPILHKLGDPNQMQLAIWGMSGLVLFYVVKSVFLGFLAWQQSRFISHLSVELTENLFRGYIDQPYIFHLQRNSAQLIRNLLTEIGQLTTLSQAFLTLVLEFSAVCGIAALLIIAEPVGAISVTLFLSVAVIIFQRLTKQRLLSWGKIRQDQGELVNKHLFQGLGGIKDVKFSGREKYFSDVLHVHLDANSKIQIRYLTISQIPKLFLELFAVVGIAGITIIMILQHKNVSLFVPTLALFGAAAFRLMPSVNKIIASAQSIRFLQPVVDVLYHEFHIIHNTVQHPATTGKFEFNHALILDNVNFSYPNTPIRTLNNIALVVNKGETLGFMGASGSGKSTLIDVILGLLTQDSGAVKVDEINIQNNMRGWQDQIGYVPQTVYLTDDTIRRNVAFGMIDEEIDNEAVRRSISDAQLESFIESLPNGLDTFVGERGVRLSGGQRQRIGIARALYHDPEILVLDEATSSLDTLSESGVMKAVTKLQGKKTILIVAHRLSTLNICDRIYKLSHGKIIAEGIPEIILNS